MRRVPGPIEATAWTAPVANGPVRGDVVVPGSKSVTNRALVLAAIADGPSHLGRPLRSRDTDLMAAALRALGVAVDETADGWLVTPAALRGSATVDVGLAGTVMRFIPALATLATGDVSIDGDPRARERPIAPLLAALRALGAVIDDTDGRLPLTVHGQGGLRGGAVTIDAAQSSQLVSALLLAAPRWDDGVELRHIGARAVPNAPHLRMTAAMLRARGVTVNDDVQGKWSVAAGPVAGRDEVIEPDLSTAAPFLAAAVVTAGTARLRDWPEGSEQPGAGLPALLGTFGAQTQRDGADLVVRGTGRITGATLDLRDAGELTPVLAAVAAVADGRSEFRGIDYLRGHETDRLAALARELSSLGCGVTETADGLVIEPAPLHGGTFHTYDDHRLAMAAAVIGLVVEGVMVDDVATTAKTFPEFAQSWTEFVRGER